MTKSTYEVIVVGGGNAGLCAALSAAENGARVLMVERAPEDERGGNSRFTAGAMRFTYNGLEDIRRLLPDLSESEVTQSEFGTYTLGQFYDDMGRVTEYRSDPDLTEILVTESFNTMVWMQKQGVRFAPMYNRQAFKINGKFRFWGGLTIEAWGGGPGLVASLYTTAAHRGIDIRYGQRVVALNYDGKRICGVRVRTRDGEYKIYSAPSVVLASGGFQANSEWRTRYLGPGWDLAKIRGSRFNTGDGIRLALDIGAMPYGNWSGCHAVGWDMNAPEFGDLAVGDGFQKHSYPFGVMVNNDGKRFVDEGADFRNYTYAKYGRRVLEQPNQVCWQVFDQKVTHLLRDEYRIARVTRVRADTLEELANKMEGVNAAAFLAEINTYNDAVQTEIPFDPTAKDGRGTIGLAIPKSNWANKLDQAPFEAYGVTCGITFTFGGLRIAADGNVLDTDQCPIEGLYAAGELVGGLFYFNYPGGTGLMAGSVFGRRAGRSAAERAKRVAANISEMAI